MQPYRPILILMAIGLLLGGCVATEKIVRQSDQSSRKLEIVYPERQILAQQQLAPDIKLVLAAVIEKMRGDRHTIDGVVFAPGHPHDLTEDDFTYEGFDLTLIDILGYEPKRLSANEADVQAAGLLHFKDAIGRKASTYFAARYSVTRNKIVVKESAIAVIPPAYPRLEAYFVPQSAFVDLPEGELLNFTDLYLYAALSAEPMVASEEERKAREAYEKMSLWKKVAAGTKGQEDYYILVFCMDRLASGSELKMTLSDSMGTLGQDLAEVVYRYDAGWRTLIAGGKFNPDSPSNHFYANVTYTLDPQGGTEPLLIGSYKNEKDYAPPRTPKMMAQQQDDPVASGAVFLNPDIPQDATQIQNRLRRLGFFQGPVDGKFSEQSKDALSRFVAAAGVEGDGIWTLEVQKKLFAKQVALSSGPISTGDKLLDPRHRSDARLIQTRLKELGFYGGKIDGLFGKGSYRALENYTLSAGIPGSGRWTLDVQKALFKGTGQ
jgi:peptidoglycan hydrolase-like protein with peptidoglycan-binding domain